jgi:hypothetical protein
LPLAAQQLQAQLQELPEAVQQQVAQLHRDYDDVCGRFQQRKEEAMAAVEHRKQVGPALPAAPGRKGPVPTGRVTVGLGIVSVPHTHACTCA